MSTLEILGVGGTIAKLTMLGEKVHVCIVTRGCPPLFNEELIRQGRIEDLKAAELLRTTSVQFLDFPAARLDAVDQVKLNNALSEVINDLKPFVVYIPHRGDIHRDHKIVADAASLKQIIPFPIEFADFIPKFFIHLVSAEKSRRKPVCVYII